VSLLRRPVQLIWLAALIVLDDRVLFARYRRRFRVPMETFRRDVRMIRRTVRSIDAVLHGNYRRYLYLMDEHLD
jgi:hypothetical protein